MHQTSRADLRLEEFATELLESCIADYRLHRLDEDSRLAAAGPLVQPKKRNGNSKLTPAMLEKIHDLRDENVPVTQIAERFSVAEQSIRRYLAKI